MSVSEVSREFFCLPLEENQKHANDPGTYVGYGSRTGVQKGAILDWRITIITTTYLSPYERRTDGHPNRMNTVYARTPFPFNIAILFFVCIQNSTCMLGYGVNGAFTSFFKESI